MASAHRAISRSRSPSRLFSPLRGVAARRRRGCLALLRSIASSALRRRRAISARRCSAAALRSSARAMPVSASTRRGFTASRSLRAGAVRPERRGHLGFECEHGFALRTDHRLDLGQLALGAAFLGACRRDLLAQREFFLAPRARLGERGALAVFVLDAARAV
jgi:hypothetical protein